MSDLISRQAAIEALSNSALVNYQAAGHDNGLVKAISVIKGLPSAQPEVPDETERCKVYGGYCGYPIAWCSECPAHDAARRKAERDIPMKPVATFDKAWGIPAKQAVCPKCDYYLGHIAFLDCYKGKRFTYCETCGQAIDWK